MYEKNEKLQNETKEPNQRKAKKWLEHQKGKENSEQKGRNKKLRERENQ